MSDTSSSSIDESAAQESPESAPETTAEATSEASPKAPRKVSSKATTKAHRSKPAASAGRWQSSPWPTIASLGLALVAVGLAAAAWFHPGKGGAPNFSEQQTTDAKTHICGGYTTVRQGVIANTHLANPTPDNPAGQLAVAANARLALLGGGAFLRDRLTAEPAAPADLAKAVGAMANTIEDLGVGYLAGLNSALDPLRENLNKEIVEIDKMCS